MKLINEQEIYDAWAPLIESKAGITDESKKSWLTKYCHYHSLNESAGAYNTLGVVNGMGNVAPPLYPGMTNFAGSNAGGSTYGANQGFYNPINQGSGDKFPSLLPLAIQVAAKTVGFDIVPVIPMSGPTGILSYLDYVYAGGKLAGATSATAGEDLADAPSMIKFPVYQTALGTGTTGATAGTFTVGTSYTVTNGGVLTLTFVGLSRIDGFPIFRITNLTSGYNVAGIINSTPAQVTVSGGSGTGFYTGASTVNYSAQLVKGLEDHIQGFSGAGFNNNQDWQGPYVDGTKTYNPMLRGVAESTYFQSMGLSTFTKFVEADTFQVAASVTTEQIQDLNKQFGIDVISMIENALVNEVSQAINKHILSRAFALGWSNHIQFNNTENQNLNLNLVLGGGTSTTAAYITKEDSNVSMTIPAGPASGGYENLSTLQRRLYSRILAAANVVANRGRRGPANFIVTNAAIASALQDISQFTFAPFTNTLTQNNGTLYPVGSLAGMTVYVDQNMRYDDTRICVGRKGGDDEPGLKFMPYMMAESIQTISEGTMSPKIAVKSRYALVEAGFLPETLYLCFYVQLPAGGIA
jgi:hypothetical protein